MSLFKDRAKEDSRNLNFVGYLTDAASEDEVSRYLKSSSLGNAHVARGDIDAAIAGLLKMEHSPQRLLVDISGSNGPLDDLDRLANACEPSVQVYVVGDRNDVGLYRSLLQRGVQDYLVKPLSADLLRRSLEDGRARQARHGKVIAVTGTRGGVGVTTVAAHLARRLAEEGGRRRVAYLDLNAYGGSGASILGLSVNDALIELLNNVSRLDPQYLSRTLSTEDHRLFALGAELEYSDPFAPEEGVLGELLDTLGQHFHYIVLDLPNTGGSLANDALRQANLACVLTDYRIYSARTLLRIVRHIEGRAHPPTVPVLANQPRAADKGGVPQR